MPTVSKVDFDEILDWLRLHDIECSAAKINRQFSDGVALAMLLKRLYPRLIDLHNYPSQNSLRLKLTNWETLNAKVLSKIGLKQSKQTLENLARGNPDAIENLLYSLMNNEHENKKRKDNATSSCENKDRLLLKEDQILMIVVNKKIGDAIVQVPQQMVLYSVYEKAMKEVDEKTKTLHELSKQIAHLEWEVQKQRDRIEELMSQEDKVLAPADVAAKAKSCNILNFFETQRLKREHESQIFKQLFEEHENLRALAMAEDEETPRPNKHFEVGYSTDDSKTLTSIESAKSPMDFSSYALLKKDPKATKIPTRNGQVIKYAREKCSWNEAGDDNSICTLQNSIVTKGAKTVKSDLLTKTFSNKDGVDFNILGSNGNSQKIASNSMFWAESLSVQGDSINKIMNSMKTFTPRRKTYMSPATISLNNFADSSCEISDSKYEMANLLLGSLKSTTTPTTELNNNNLNHLNNDTKSLSVNFNSNSNSISNTNTNANYGKSETLVKDQLALGGANTKPLLSKSRVKSLTNAKDSRSLILEKNSKNSRASSKHNVSVKTSGITAAAAATATAAAAAAAMAVSASAVSTIEKDACLKKYLPNIAPDNNNKSNTQLLKKTISEKQKKSN